MRLCRNRWQNKWLALDIIDPKLQTLADEAERFCGHWFRNDTNKSLLVISGETGSGKTHTAKAIHNFCVRASSAAFDTEKWGHAKFPDTTFISWPEAANEFNNKSLMPMQDALDSALTILDDVGAENDPWKICADKLCQILSRREQKFTVITTNIPPAQWAEKFDIRINDRLLRNSVIVDINGVSSYALKP